MNRFHKFLITFIYSVLVLYIVLFSGQRSEINSRSVNLYPVQQRIEELRDIKHHESGSLLNFIANFFGNILLFIPLPIVALQLFPFLSNKSIILFAFITSISIEILQFIFERGIADIDDITLNVAGSIAGLVLYKIYVRWKSEFIQTAKP